MTKGTLPASILAELKEVLRILVNHGVRRVIIYGSFARGDFRQDSDFDLCVEGLSSRDYFLAFAECLRATNRPLSIVELQDVKGYFRERILSEGKVIYDSTTVSTKDPVRA